MGVIALPNIAPKGPGARIDWELRSNTARFPSTLTGYTRTLERPGGHFAATLRYENLNGAEAARLRAFLSACRGQAQRFYLRDFGYTQRGSFPAPELFTNNTFANGTTGWTAGTAASLYSVDGSLRVIATEASSAWQVRQAVSGFTQYAPYALRSILIDGAQSAGLNIGLSLNDASGNNATAYSASARGLITVTKVMESTSGANMFPFDVNVSSGFTAGAYVTIPYASLARCALVDNGPNELLRSDEMDNAAWTKSGTTVSGAYYSAPDGTVTGDRLIEDTSTGEHFAIQSVTRTNAVDTWCFAVALRRGDVSNLRDRAMLRILDSGASSRVAAIFDLTNGVISQAASVIGSAANPRASMQSLGGGWYYCCVICQLPASDTTVRACINLVENPSTASYTGSSSQNIGVWRATLARSHVPIRLTQTTSAGDTDGVAQTGSALYLKGLPASTDGLLLQGDLAESITPSGSQFVRARAALNSDAAGLGYFEFEPPLRESPVDNAAVIVCNPLMRAMLDDRSVRWSQRHAGFVDLEFTAVEDMTA